jgi:hypothetical protein
MVGFRACLRRTIKGMVSQKLNDKTHGNE